MRKRARNFTLEFKKKVVELSHARGNAKAVAEELNISHHYYIVGVKS